MAGLPADFFGSILGTWWRPKGGGDVVEVNGWSSQGQICRLSDSAEIGMFDLFAQYDHVVRGPREARCSGGETVSDRPAKVTP